jgi:hypothetical protein
MKHWASCYCRTSAQIKRVSLNLFCCYHSHTNHDYISPRTFITLQWGKHLGKLQGFRIFQKLHNIMNVLFQFFIFSSLTFHLLYKFNFSSMLWPFSHVFPPWCKFPTHLFIHHAIPHLFWNLTKKKLKHFT